MMASPVSADMLRRITPSDARSYARAKGWQRVEGIKGRLAVFSFPKSDLDQLLVPLDHITDDYAERIADVVAKLAEVEGRSPIAIANDLLNQDADVLRYRIVSARTEAGTLPLIDGLGLLEGARRSLLAAACSVVSPRRYHPRMSRAEANQLVSACRLGQTERGSFTVTISCPLRAVDTGEEGGLLDFDSFARQTTLLLANSFARLSIAIEQDRPHSVIDEHNGTAKSQLPVVSANLCDALLRMRPDQEESSLQFGVRSRQEIR